MRHLFIGTLASAALLLSASFFAAVSQSENTIFHTTLSTFSIGTTNIEIAIADTPQARRLGLSHLSSLREKQGLLFVFPKSDFHGIWMKDMLFPIDIIWLDENLHVVDLSLNVSPDTYPKTFHPKSPARYVLEVNAGFSEKYDVAVGSRAKWSSR
ncbi:DUF192 domain-containing protein [Candidatus Kaiserbacteria bacterium]|nr:DUF192 domain-containing protein [Candidatus Kaiserbacteria bacterium]